MQSCQACLLTSQVLYLGKELGHFLTTWIHLYKTLMKITFLFQLADTDTAQKMKFPIKDSSVNVAKSAVSCGFGHIY